MTAEEVRTKRDELIADSDKHVLPDYPHTENERCRWRRYRQQLRDITAQPGFPDIVAFPDVPENDPATEAAEAVSEAVAGTEA